MTPRRPLLVALSGFLGAGKTTTLAALAGVLERRGRRVAIVTNDQGVDLVDTRVAVAAGTPVAEVTGGCFCCRFDDLAAVVSGVVDDDGADVVLAEAVGSCTDLSATVARPLRRDYGDRMDVAPLAAIVDPARFATLGRSLALDDASSDLAYLFDRQLADADIVAINKIDVASADEVDAVWAAVQARHRHVRVVTYSAVTGEGLDALVDVLCGPAPPERDIDVDYDRYAAAEAELAWLNHTVVLTPDRAGTFAPAHWARSVLSALGDTAALRGWWIGHAKVVIEPPGHAGSFTKLSLIDAGETPMLDADGGAMDRATVRINARVACRPDELDAAIVDAISIADVVEGSTSASERRPSSFAPAYPRPQHRLPAAPSG